MYFPYGETEIAYLKGRDKRLGKAIDQIGPVYRETEGDLFTSVVHQIVGQQISSAALRTVWARLVEKAGRVTPEALCRCGREELQSCGISFRKAEYILAFARRVELFAPYAPGLPELPDIRAWCAARERNYRRERGSFGELFRLRRLIPSTTLFELLALRMPRPLFRLAVWAVQRRLL